MATFLPLPQIPSHGPRHLARHIEAHAFIGGSVSSIISSTTSTIRNLSLGPTRSSDTASPYEVYASLVLEAILNGLESLRKINIPSSLSLESLRKPGLHEHLMSEAIAITLWKLVQTILNRVNPILEVVQVDSELYFALERIGQVLCAMFEDIQLIFPSISLEQHWEAVDSVWLP